jgi:hypothetical protein
MYDVARLWNILESTASPCSKEYWFASPDCCQLAADTFGVPIVHCDATNDSHDYLFFPMELPPPARRKNPIILCLLNNDHYVTVECNVDFNMKWPRISPHRL